MESIGVRVLSVALKVDGTSTPSTNNTGVSPFPGGVTVKLGRLVRVRSSPLELPVSVAGVMSGAALGALGLVISIFSVKGCGSLALPLESRATNCKLF